MDKFNIYLKKFKIAIGILAAVLIISIIIIAKLVPVFQNISNIQKEHSATSKSLVDAERRLAELKKSQQEEMKEERSYSKAFFRPISGGFDTESAVSEEFGEILQIMRENKIKARTFKYDYDPQDDNFVKNMGNKFHVCRISADLIASYSQFENFLKDLFKHEHFLEISKIEIVPYQKNKRILLVNLQIKLYAQKDPSQLVESPAQTPTEESSAEGAADTEEKH